MIEVYMYDGCIHAQVIWSPTVQETVKNVWGVEGLDR